MNEQISGNTRQYSTFFVDGLFFGIDVTEVQEVLRPQEMTRVALAADVIEGLINLRGQIVTAIDMRRRLMLAPRSGEAAPMNMVVCADDCPVSLLVDEIGDVVTVGADTYEAPPANLPAEHRPMIEAVHKLDGRLLLVLDRDRVLDTQVDIQTAVREERTS